MPARHAVAVFALLLAATAGWSESVHREVLPSGLVVIVQEFHATPAVEVRVSVRAGPLSEGPLLGSGASVLLQRLLVSSGSAAQGADEVKRAIARLGNEFNATTTVASTSYSLSTVSDKTGDALALLASMLSNYQYSQLDLQREREAVLAMPAPTPEVLAELLLNSLLYRQHPARLPVTGTPRMMDQLTVDLMRRYQAARYTAANTVVTVVGNVNTNDVRKWADQAFAHYSVGGYQPATPFIEPAQYAPRYASGQLELPEQRVVLAWRSEAMEHPAQPALWVLAELLGAPGHGLLDRAFAARSLPLPVTVSNRAPIDQAGCIAFAFACAPLQRADCEQTVRACLDALVKDGPSVDALASAKAALRRRLSERATSTAAIAEGLASWELAAGDPGFGRRHREAIEATTADDVVRVARRYIVTDMDAHACTVVLRPGAESLASGSGGTVQPPTGTLAPEIVDLGKGARLIVRQDQELPLVHLRLGVGGGAGIEEPAVAGIGAVLAELATRGVEGRSRAQIDALCQRAGFDLSADCGPHALGIALTCLPEELDRGLELLLDLATRSSLPAAELAQVKAITEQRREATEGAWDERLLAAARGALLGEHYGARSPQGSRDAVAGLDRATILAHWQRLTVAPNLVIAVYGRFDRTALRATLDRLLASHAMRDGPRPAPLVAVGPASSSPMSIGFHPAELAAVALAWPAPPLAERGRDEAA
ncbi:MAG: insulinase family protein, partial [Planctomycetes bacterium]|nr:insulinase family protein [Planctomycetota bacterium]